MRQNENSYLFVVGGPGSSGSSTISKMLSEYFHIPRVYAGGIFRQKAKDAGFESFEDFLVHVTKNHFYVDNQIDEELVKIAQKGNVVIESKIFAPIATVKDIKCTAKIWIDADLHTRTKRRILKEGTKGIFNKIIKYITVRKNLKKRYSIDGRKYWDLYRVHYDKPEMYYDFVLDSSSLNEEETFKLILNFLRNGGYIKE